MTNHAAGHAGTPIERANIETRLGVLTWMVGSNIGLTLLLLGSMFAMWSKLGDIASQISRLAH